MKEKIIRKITFEIFEKGFQTQTHQIGIYEKNIITGALGKDIFKEGKTTEDVKRLLFSSKEGQRYLKSAFSGNKAEFVTVKINKRGTSKFIVMRYEYANNSKRKFN